MTDASDPSTLPPPVEQSKVSFTGGIRSRVLGFGGTAPFGHLEFDAAELRIWGLGMEVEVRRTEVRGVHLSIGILATRVRVVYQDGSTARVYFASLGRAGVREALQRRGWPVIER